MPRRAGRDLYARALLEGKRTESRYTDLCVELVDERDLEPILHVGGRWDRKLRQWTEEDPLSSLQIKIHPGQLEAATWFRDWMEAYLLDADLPEPVYSAMFLGGSRSGKTYLGLGCLAAFTVAVPGSRVWAVQEVDVERADELENELNDLLPAAWFRKTGKRYECANGSVITIRSAKHPSKLKRGRCDFAFLNEAQNVREAAHNMLRMRTSDTSGIVINAANPPDTPEGQWVAEYSEDCRAGRRPAARCFRFNPQENPHINRTQLEALRTETDPRTFEIEVMGKVLPPANAVYHAFSTVENLDTPPELPGADVTADFLRRQGLGAKAEFFAGLDFQRTPHMAAVVGKAFRNPDNPDRPLLYYLDEVIVELGDEHDLSDGLYRIGLDPATTVLVGDASGSYQDADRTQNNSYDLLRERGWKRIHTPDRFQKRNPSVSERIKNDNRLFHAADGQHIVRIDPGCEFLVEAVKKWTRKSGAPNKRSRYAHICEAMSYANFRLYPRRLQSTKVGYRRIKGRARPSQMRQL